MPRRCDRCRTEYESGVDHGGKDYCMTCYVKVKAEEDTKRHKEEQAREQKEKQKQQQMRDALEKQSKERETHRAVVLGDSYQTSVHRRELEQVKKEQEKKVEEDRHKREVAEEKLFQQQIQQRIDQKKEAEEVARHRHRWDISAAVLKEPAKKPEKKAKKSEGLPIATGVALGVSMPGARSEKGGKSELKSHQGGSGFDEEHVELSLQAVKGLPVSLSCGQKGNNVVLVGKNKSVKSVTVELICELRDSKGKDVVHDAEPEHCTITSNTETSFSIKFDLQDETPTGALTLNAHLKENAVYVDRECAQSEQLALTSQVKTPLELEYKMGSSEFAEEKGKLYLCLTFNNRGESGGILNAASKAAYGADKKFEHAELGEKVKIKGRQKNAVLKFAVEKKGPLDVLSFDFAGIDSNGKPYALLKNVKEKKKEGNKTLRVRTRALGRRSPSAG